MVQSPSSTELKPRERQSPLQNQQWLLLHNQRQKHTSKQKPLGLNSSSTSSSSSSVQLHKNKQCPRKRTRHQPTRHHRRMQPSSQHQKQQQQQQELPRAHHKRFALLYRSIYRRWTWSGGGGWCSHQPRHGGNSSSHKWVTSYISSHQSSPPSHRAEKDTKEPQDQMLSLYLSKKETKAFTLADIHIGHPTPKRD